MPEGKTDYDRLFGRELVYTGVRRTPVCAVLPWIVAAELFATTLDAYLILGMIPENPDDHDTADGRPATRKCAHARLARMYCADAEMVPEENIRTLAEGIRDQQVNQIKNCISAVERRLETMPSSQPPRSVVQSQIDALLAGGDESKAEELQELLRKYDVQYITSGSGEFLAQQALYLHDISLNDKFGPAVSACAPAYAVAVLATER